MTDASGTTSYTYDGLDRLITKTTQAAGMLTYSYDAAGHVASIKSSNSHGASVNYTYDGVGRLSTVVDNWLTGQNTTTYSYYPANNVYTISYPNGSQSTFTYDQLNRLTGLNSSTGSATYGYTYQLGATGNRTQATESTGAPTERTLNWNYDNIYRLTKETIASDPAGEDGYVNYVLDPVGNRTSATSTLSGIDPIAASYNPDDEASTETYDSNGNAQTAAGNSFAYDSENHLISMNSGAVTLVYDGDGNRVAKTTSSGTTMYLVDDMNPTGYPQVMDEIAGGVVKREYTYGLQRISENQYLSGAWTPSFYGYDGAGSVRYLTSTTEAVTDTYGYDAFGNEVDHTGTTANNYLYRGEQWDPDLGLYYLRARYMNPLTGRFLSRDPKPGHIAIPGTLHKYLYASADPVDRADPLGESDLAEENLEQAEPEAAEPGERAVASRLNCILETGAGALNALGAIQAGDILGSGMAAITLVENWETCSGEASGKEPEPEPNSKPGTCPKCFAAGTPVHTNRGDVPVEQVKVGDEVVSRSKETDKLESQPVTALIPPHTAPLLEMRIEGERTPLRPSTGHSFWVKRGDAADGSWMEAANMRVGDLLQTMQGAWRRVVSITPLEGQETVYNFTVAKDHDYFVGETGFLVHNANCFCDLPQPMDPNEIRFSQRYISGSFSDGTPLQQTIDALRSGELSPGDLPPIRVFEGPGGGTFTLDNRRLFASQMAGVPVNTVPATAEEIEREAWKMTTRCQGKFVGVKGGPIY